LTMIKHYVLRTAIKKALTSSCRYRISALGFNKRGELVATTTNKPRFYRKGGGVHAEMALMLGHPKSLKTILICRVGKNGDLAQIDPCVTCNMKAAELGIKIITVYD